MGTVSHLPPSLSETGRGSLPSLKSACFHGNPCSPFLRSASVSSLGLPPRVPRTPCGRLGPRPGLPAAYLLLGPAELLLHLLGEEAGSAARPALSHPAGSPGAACPGPAPCGFLQAPREGSAVPVMPCIRPGGLEQLTPPRCHLGSTLDCLRPRAGAGRSRRPAQHRPRAAA